MEVQVITRLKPQDSPFPCIIRIPKEAPSRSPLNHSVSTGSQAPLRMPNNVWKLRDESVQADATTHRLGLQHPVWLRTLRGWLDRSGIEELQCRCNSLHSCGLASSVFGLNMRPRLSHGPAASKEKLSDYNIPATRRNLQWRCPTADSALICKVQN